MAHFIKFDTHHGHVVHFLNFERIVHVQATLPPKDSDEAGGGVVVQFEGGGSLRLEGPIGASFLEVFTRHLTEYQERTGSVDSPAGVVS